MRILKNIVILICWTVVILFVLLVAIGIGKAQDVTVENDSWVCSSPRSGTVIYSGTRDEAIAYCGGRAFEMQADYVVEGTVRLRIDPVPSLDPGTPPPPDPVPPPDPTDPPTDPNLPAFTFDIKGAASGVLGAHDSACTNPQTVHVTSLSNDQDTPGTLMNAVRGDCRYIVFDVAGTIDMTNALPGNINDSGGLNTWRITRSYLTIDGRTAPSPGITLTNADRISIECRGPRPCVGAHDIIISNLRAVSPWPAGAQPKGTMALFLVDGSEGNTTGNVVLDHLTIANSGQGGCQVYNQVSTVTIQGCFMYGAMLGHHISGPGMIRENISIFKGVYARMNERQPRLRYDNRFIDYVGNVIYGWGYYEGGASGLVQGSGTGDASSSGNFEFNRYIDNPAAPFACQGNPVDKSDCARVNEGTGGVWYFADNVWPANEMQGDTVSAPARVSIPIPLPREYATAADVMGAGTHYPTPEETALLTEIVQAAGL